MAHVDLGKNADLLMMEGGNEAALLVGAVEAPEEVERFVLTLVKRDFVVGVINANSSTVVVGAASVIALNRSALIHIMTTMVIEIIVTVTVVVIAEMTVTVIAEIAVIVIEATGLAVEEEEPTARKRVVVTFKTKEAAALVSAANSLIHKSSETSKRHTNTTAITSPRKLMLTAMAA